MPRTSILARGSFNSVQHRPGRRSATFPRWAIAGQELAASTRGQALENPPGISRGGVEHERPFELGPSRGGIPGIKEGLRQHDVRGDALVTPERNLQGINRLASATASQVDP